MENEYTYHFRETENGIITVTEKNTKITYTISKQHRIWRFVIEYKRVRIAKTARARVVYFMHNNRVTKFKRALLPTITHKLDEIGISISVTQ